MGAAGVGHRPQGVLDVVNMTGTLVKAFAGLDQVGAEVHLQWVIYFPGCRSKEVQRRSDLFDPPIVERACGSRERPTLGVVVRRLVAIIPTRPECSPGPVPGRQGSI